MKTRSQRKWLTPQREGQTFGRKSKRYCRRCGVSVRHVPILSVLNLCERCANELKRTRDGRWSCKGCGRIVPLQLESRGGYCKDCVCTVCGKPDPVSVHETGLCKSCLGSVGLFCKACGKEAPTQVKRNKGFCDLCLTQH